MNFDAQKVPAKEPHIRYAMNVANGMVPVPKHIKTRLRDEFGLEVPTLAAEAHIRNAFGGLLEVLRTSKAPSLNVRIIDLFKKCYEDDLSGGPYMAEENTR